MNHNVTQENAAAARPFPQTTDEEEGDCSGRPMISTPETEEILRQLDEIKYHPKEETLRYILKYAGTPSVSGH